jgi:hypothetical protein
MSFKIILVGIIVMFSTFMLTAAIILNILPPTIYIWSMTAIGIISGLFLAVIAIMLNGVIEPFISAKASGSTLLSVITASKNIDLLLGNEKQGWAKTKRGYFNIRPNSVYTWPNGVRGVIAFYKYGISLEPQFIEAASRLREAGFNDIGEVHAAMENAKKKGKELIINLDGDYIVREKEQAINQ